MRIAGKQLDDAIGFRKSRGQAFDPTDQIYALDELIFGESASIGGGREAGHCGAIFFSGLELRGPVRRGLLSPFCIRRGDDSVHRAAQIFFGGRCLDGLRNCGYVIGERIAIADHGRDEADRRQALGVTRMRIAELGALRQD